MMRFVLLCMVLPAIVGASTGLMGYHWLIGGLLGGMSTSVWLLNLDKKATVYILNTINKRIT